MSRVKMKLTIRKRRIVLSFEKTRASPRGDQEKKHMSCLQCNRAPGTHLPRHPLGSER